MIFLQTILCSVASAQTNALAITQTFTYHQITAIPDNGPVGRTSVAISGNGNLVAYGQAGRNQLQTVFVMNPDGTGLRPVDSFTALCFCGAQVDLSDDGTVVVSTEGEQVRIANTDGSGGQQLIVVDGAGSIPGVRIEGDKKRVFFMVSRDAVFRGTSTVIQRGVYVINADGSGLRQIVGPSAIAALFGTTIGNTISPAFENSGGGKTIDVSVDGSRIVFLAQRSAGGTVGGLFGVNLDGSGLHQFLGGTVGTFAVGISADGSKMVYNITLPGTLTLEMGVASFDGSGRRTLATGGFANGFAKLTSDASRVVWFDSLYKTDGSGATQLSTSTTSLNGLGDQVYMNATGTRFIYNFVAPGTFSQGLSPGFVGLYQVNVQVPANAPTGDAVPLALTIGGVASNTVTIAVQ